MAAKKNYNKISTEKATEEKVETVETVEAVEVVEEAVEETVEVKPNIAEGKVVKCTRLNVRKNPKKDAEILKVITTNTRVTIDLDNSNKSWYKLVGGELAGYVMKEFIEISK